MKSLPSSGEYRVRQARRRLVLDVFLNRGAAAARIQDMRERWGIQPETRMPPPYRGGKYTPASFGPPPEEQFEEQADVWHAKYQEWCDDLAVLYKAVVPEEARDDGDSETLVSGWGVFLSLCVLFDPPETQLEEFAEAFTWEYSNVIPHGEYRINALPIVWRRDDNRTEATWMQFFNGIIEALCEKYVYPQGVTSEEAWSLIRKENAELFERLREGLHDNKSRPYIDVRPYTRKEDVESAFLVLRDRNETRPVPGRNKRDELTAVQCAILYDRHNVPDIEDQRRWTWPYERLAEEFELESRRAAKAHVELGRELLAKYRGQ